MDTETIFFIASTVIAILLAIWAGSWVIKKRSQSAKADNGSTVIQSGRDTKIK